MGKNVKFWLLLSLPVLHSPRYHINDGENPGLYNSKVGGVTANTYFNFLKLSYSTFFKRSA